ncbi:MAG: peptidylprolyl isomerase [Sedimentisphaerales bacterium]|nr:peptidylprolyl isomerase [Sedimentisphaerales bacterium]
MKIRLYQAVQLFSGVLVLIVAGGCESSPPRVATPSFAPVAQPDIIARVNNAPMFRQDLETILYHGRGATLLEDCILLEVVRQEARRRGLSDNPNRILQERRRVLDDMAPGKSPTEQQALLDYMLKRRGLTQPEFDVILEKQALLRDMVAGDVVVTEQALAEQFEREHGGRVQVRQIVLGTLARVDEAVRRLAAGELFATVAADMSEDERTSPEGGLTMPFSRMHDDIAPAVRKAAFALDPPGDRSEPIHYLDNRGRDRWVILELVQNLPPDGITMEQVRSELTETVRRRLTSAAMLSLQQSLREKALVDIIDPALRSPTVLP